MAQLPPIPAPLLRQHLSRAFPIGADVSRRSAYLATGAAPVLVKACSFHPKPDRGPTPSTVDELVVSR